MSVTRWEPEDPYAPDPMDMDPNGRYVRFDDYEALTAERDRLKAENDARKNLHELLDKLLACYRAGRNPGALLDRIGSARSKLDRLDQAAKERGEA